MDWEKLESCQLSQLLHRSSHEADGISLVKISVAALLGENYVHRRSGKRLYSKVGA